MKILHIKTIFLQCIFIIKIEHQFSCIWALFAFINIFVSNNSSIRRTLFSISLCLFSCHFKFPFWFVEYSHFPHIKTDLLLCVFVWLYNFILLTHSNPHSGHLLWSSLWMFLMCCKYSFLLLNTFPQIRHSVWAIVPVTVTGGIKLN